MTAPKLPTYSNQPLRPELAGFLEQLQPGQRIRITQTVRVGMKSWPATIEGAFRHVDSLATGLATERVPEDDILVPIIHFTKDNGELSSVAVDENTRVELVEGRSPAPAPSPEVKLDPEPTRTATPLADPQ